MSLPSVPFPCRAPRNLRVLWRRGTPWVLSLALHAVAFRCLPGDEVPGEAGTEGAPSLQGDTFVVVDPAGPAVEPPGRSSPDGPPSSPPPSAPSFGPAPTVSEGNIEPSPMARPPKAGASKGKTKAPSTGAAPGGSEGPDLFGAVGDRSAVDLATAFTRAFPQAASADPQWVNAPFGPAGQAVLTLELDGEGHVQASQITGSPSPALLTGLRRTLLLLGARSFTARSRRTILLLRASVSQDTVHDGLHGDVFALGASYTGGRGLSYFALAVGRRIDLHVEEKNLVPAHPEPRRLLPRGR